MREAPDSISCLAELPTHQPSWLGYLVLAVLPSETYPLPSCSDQEHSRQLHIYYNTKK